MGTPKLCPSPTAISAPKSPGGFSSARDKGSLVTVIRWAPTVSHADRIYVVEDGRAVESGRHDELLRKGGRYASFYTLQLEAQEPDSPVVAVASS